MIDTPLDRDKVAALTIEEHSQSDNLVIALMCYFEGHIEHEELGVDENENDIWALRKANEAINLITQQLTSLCPKKSP